MARKLPSLLKRGFSTTLRSNFCFLADYLEGGNRQIHFTSRIVFQGSVRRNNRKGYFGNIVGNDRPLIEQIIGETGGNLHLQRTCADSPTIYIRDLRPRNHLFDLRFERQEVGFHLSHLPRALLPWIFFYATYKC